MIFFYSISEQKKELTVNQRMRCAVCGAYSGLQAAVTCTVLSVFFIPCFRWNRKYYVRFGCCGSIYGLDPAVGRKLENGEEMEIEESDLTLLEKASGYASGYASESASESGHSSGYAARYASGRKCPNCGCEAEEHFVYCPKCGKRISSPAITADDFR